MEICQQPDLDRRDAQVLAEIHPFREGLAASLRVPARWQGALRRT